MSTSSSPPIRVLLDVTIAATANLNSGIQRVVRNLTREAESTGPELDLQCVPFVCYGDALCVVDFEGRQSWDIRTGRWLFNTWMNLHRAIARRLNGGQAVPDHVGQIDRQSKRPGDRYLLFLSRIRKLALPKTPLRWLKGLYVRMTGKQIRFQKDDILVLLDASWNIPIDSIIDRARSQGASVVTVIYDLIPVLHPEFHDESLRKVFETWLRTVVEKSDAFVGISQTVADELSAYIKSNRRLSNSPVPDVAAFRLGADFQSKRIIAERPEPKPEVDTRLIPGEFYLMVGTIEPRKNHTFVLDAMEKVWESRPEVTLCIAGKIGWMCTEVESRLSKLARKHRLIFLDDVDDRQLSWLYENAKALLFASIVEGFGLPIVEAFQSGLPVLASDTRIHREVAGSWALYFPLEHPQRLADLLQRIEEQSQSLIRPDHFPITTWNQSCRQFLEWVKRLGDRSVSDAAPACPTSCVDPADRGLPEDRENSLDPVTRRVAS